MRVTRLRDSKGRYLDSWMYRKLLDDLESILKTIGFSCEVIPETRSSFRISNVRLRTDVWSYNRSPYTGRRGKILNYVQWGLVNYATNAVLDRYGVAANVSSLNGLFVVRKGYIRHRFIDWTEREYDNVGSVVEPVYRINAWKPEDFRKFRKAFINAIEHLKDTFPENTDYINDCYEYVLERIIA